MKISRAKTVTEVHVSRRHSGPKKLKICGRHLKPTEKRGLPPISKMYKNSERMLMCKPPKYLEKSTVLQAYLDHRPLKCSNVLDDWQLQWQHHRRMKPLYSGEQFSSSWGGKEKSLNVGHVQWVSGWEWLRTNAKLASKWLWLCASSQRPSVCFWEIEFKLNYDLNQELYTTISAINISHGNLKV